MKPGDLRQFVDSMVVLGVADVAWESRAFIVLKVTPTGSVRTVDILLDGRLEEGLGYRWVEDNSETINEAR